MRLWYRSRFAAPNRPDNQHEQRISLIYVLPLEASPPPTHLPKIPGHAIVIWGTYTTYPIPLAMESLTPNRLLLLARVMAVEIPAQCRQSNCPHSWFGKRPDQAVGGVGRMLDDEKYRCWIQSGERKHNLFTHTNTNTIRTPRWRRESRPAREIALKFSICVHSRSTCRDSIRYVCIVNSLPWSACQNYYSLAQSNNLIWRLNSNLMKKVSR